MFIFIGIIFVAFVVKSGIAQGILPSGDPYFCVPSGICPPTGGGIDPRIVTPGGTPTTPPPGVVSCPSGRVPCYAQGSMSTCGQRRPITNTADGFAEVGAYPWQAFLIGPAGPNNYIGSGSLISPYHVLTASHKVLAYVNNPSQLTVIMGVNNPATINNAPAAPRSVASGIAIYNAEAYNQNGTIYNNMTLKNDIAIVRVATPFSLLNPNAVNTICLPPATANALTYSSPPQRCVVSGWGQVQPTNSAVPTQLKQVTVNTTDIQTCARGFSGTVDTATYLDTTGGQICAGGEAQKDACFQDGGAPMVCGAYTATTRFTVAGIVIWGKSCGVPGVYGVYTNVPPYRAWILRLITQPIA